MNPFFGATFAFHFREEEEEEGLLGRVGSHVCMCLCVSVFVFVLHVVSRLQFRTLKNFDVI
jgi:hypothetical protein